jgi:hypothetical protein
MYLPSALLNFFFRADNILDKLQRQKTESKGGNLSGIGQIIERLKNRKKERKEIMDAN